MEKNKPHHSRDTIKKLIEAGNVSVTATAIKDSMILGIDRDCMLKTVCMLTAKDFYKSITSYSDPQCWQDVYHSRIKNELIIYIKLTITDGVLVLSFKEK